MPPASNFSSKVKVKITGSLTLVSIKMASLLMYACQTWSICLLHFKHWSWQQTNRQTWQKQTPLIIPSWGIKTLTWIFFISKNKLLTCQVWIKSSTFCRSIRNIATNVASMFTHTCLFFFDCRDVISIVVTSSKYVGNFDHRSNLTWSFEQFFLRFTDSSELSQFVN